MCIVGQLTQVRRVVRKLLIDLKAYGKCIHAFVLMLAKWRPNIGYIALYYGEQEMFPHFHTYIHVSASEIKSRGISATRGELRGPLTSPRWRVK